MLLSDEGDADWKYAFAADGRLVASAYVRATIIADNGPEWVAVCAAGPQRAPGESPECRVPVRDRLTAPCPHCT